MAEELDMQKARKVYDSLIRMLDERDWKYEKEEEKLRISSGIRGDDLPIQFIVDVKPLQQVVQFISPLPFRMPEDKRVDGAIAVCVANYGIINGCFDYDISDGEILFRLTTGYRDSVLGDDLFEYMIMVAASTIDNYNDKFFMLAKGMMNIQQFIENENS